MKRRSLFRQTRPKSHVISGSLDALTLGSAPSRPLLPLLLLISVCMSLRKKQCVCVYVNCAYVFVCVQKEVREVTYLSAPTCIHIYVYFFHKDITVCTSMCQKCLKTSKSLSGLPRDGAGAQEASKEDEIKKQFLGLSLSNKCLIDHANPSGSRLGKNNFPLQGLPAISLCLVQLLHKTQPRGDIQQTFSLIFSHGFSLVLCRVTQSLTQEFSKYQRRLTELERLSCLVQPSFTPRPGAKSIAHPSSVSFTGSNLHLSLHYDYVTGQSSKRRLKSQKEN